MKHIKLFALALIAFSGISSSAHAGWWYHRPPAVVVAGPPPVVIGVGYRHDYYAYHHHSLDVDVQVALARRGYYHGPIDGDIGPGTSAAIRAYQYDNGLRVTGYIDGALIRSLRL
jgi:Putative peptidoglycan binding domain